MTAIGLKSEKCSDTYSFPVGVRRYSCPGREGGMGNPCSGRGIRGYPMSWLRVPLFLAWGHHEVIPLSAWGDRGRVGDNPYPS